VIIRFVRILLPLSFARRGIGTAGTVRRTNLLSKKET